jgi:hypothetical protein
MRRKREKRQLVTRGMLRRFASRNDVDIVRLAVGESGERFKLTRPTTLSFDTNR